MGTLKTRAGILFCFLIVSCIISGSSLWAVKTASIVICAETGKVHHEHNADVVTHPASLTKMMTLYLAFQALGERKLTFNQKLPVSKHATLAAPSKLWLKAGSTITVRDVILAMVTKSANDASIVMAEALGKGSEAHFATLMTIQARRLGMSKTVFRNAHGLPHKQQNVTTARDMATLSRCLYKHFPEYFKFFKEPKFVYKGQVHANHNHLLGKIPGVDGIKTGFINASGFNLAASIVRNNRRIIAVVMGGESVKARDTKMVKLLEATYLFLDKKNHSIDDLLFTLMPSEDQTTPISRKTKKIHKAVYREHCKPARLVKAMHESYKSVDDILDNHHPTIEQKILSTSQDKPKNLSKKSKQKSVPKKLGKTITCNNNKKSKSRALKNNKTLKKPRR